MHQLTDIERKWFNQILEARWIFRCAESACPVFWKSPVRIEEIIVPEVIIAA